MATSVERTRSTPAQSKDVIHDPDQSYHTTRSFWLPAKNLITELMTDRADVSSQAPLKGNHIGTVQDDVEIPLHQSAINCAVAADSRLKKTAIPPLLTLASARLNPTSYIFYCITDLSGQRLGVQQEKRHKERLVNTFVQSVAERYLSGTLQASRENWPSKIEETIAGYEIYRRVQYPVVILHADCQVFLPTLVSEPIFKLPRIYDAMLFEIACQGVVQRPEKMNLGR